MQSIKWQWTKEDASPFKTQIEILNEHLLPLISDDEFVANQRSFYITRVFLTQVRLNVYADSDRIATLTQVVARHTQDLVLNPHESDGAGGWRHEDNGWNGRSSESPFDSECRQNFYTNYLNDITKVGLDLHAGGVIPAIRKAGEVCCRLQFGLATPREALEIYFDEQSAHYRSKSGTQKDTFWGPCGVGFSQDQTNGLHFYYNIVMGLDPSGVPCGVTDLVNEVITRLA